MVTLRGILTTNLRLENVETLTTSTKLASAQPLQQSLKKPLVKYAVETKRSFLYIMIQGSRRSAYVKKQQSFHWGETEAKAQNLEEFSKGLGLCCGLKENGPQREWHY